jgi:hypothetical protein
VGVFAVADGDIVDHCRELDAFAALAAAVAALAPLVGGDDWSHLWASGEHRSTSGVLESLGESFEVAAAYQERGSVGIFAVTDGDAVGCYRQFDAIAALAPAVAALAPLGSGPAEVHV